MPHHQDFSSEQISTGKQTVSPANQDRLDFARRIALEAGAIVRRGFRKKLNAMHKGEIDLVTEYDLASEEYITQAIQDRYPDDGILAEENGLETEGEFRWIIDPIDGTTNFARGIVPWSISIACGIGKDMQVGAVYDPMQEELFSAVKNGGAWLNGDRLVVSKVDDLNDGFFATGFPYDIRTHKQKNLREFSLMSVTVLAIRRLGSAALDLAYVAAGRYDGYWEHRLGPWDAAAGMLVVLEAGGVVTRIDGGEDIFAKPASVLATNGLIHDQAMVVLNSIQ
ncbi:MAG: inositol monophosphatase [Anaerolineales bacterium]|nr:inositol monophosphatase [Anaerolineales bacterium]